MVKKTQQYCEGCGATLLTDVTKSWEELCPNCDKEIQDMEGWCDECEQLEEEEENYFLEGDYFIGEEV